jgi:hypothetical protein
MSGLMITLVKGSATNPLTRSPNWNRAFEFQVDAPVLQAPDLAVNHSVNIATSNI